MTANQFYNLLLHKRIGFLLTMLLPLLMLIDLYIPSTKTSKEIIEIFGTKNGRGKYSAIRYTVRTDKQQYVLSEDNYRALQNVDSLTIIHSILFNKKIILYSNKNEVEVKQKIPMAYDVLILVELIILVVIGVLGFLGFFSNKSQFTVYQDAVGLLSLGTFFIYLFVNTKSFIF